MEKRGILECFNEVYYNTNIYNLRFVEMSTPLLVGIYRNTCISNVSIWFKLFRIAPPPRWPSGTVLASSAGGPGFNPQSRTAPYQRRFENGTSSALV